MNMGEEKDNSGRQPALGRKDPGSPAYGLVVDADETRAGAVAAQLEELGFDADFEQTPSAGLSHLMNRNVDVVFVDESVLRDDLSVFLLAVHHLRPWVRVVILSSTSFQLRLPAAHPAAEPVILRKPLATGELEQTMLRQALIKQESLQPRNPEALEGALDHFISLFRHTRSAIAKSGLNGFLNNLGPAIGGFVEYACAVVLDLSSDPPAFTVILREKLAPAFVDQAVNELVAVHNAFSGIHIQPDAVVRRHRGPACSEDAPQRIGDQFTLPIYIQHQLEGYLSLVSTRRHAYGGANMSFLYQASQQLPRLLPALHELHHLAIRDSFTGLYNRVFSENRLRQIWQESRADNSPFAVLLIDVDRFKRINDVYGHSVGDRILREMSRLIMDSARKTDTVGRYGGDELTVLLPNTTEQQALTCAERFLNAVRQHVFCSDTTPLHLAVSIGLATSGAPGVRSETDVLELADKAMYQAKDEGGNRVVACGHLPKAEHAAAFEEGAAARAVGATESEQQCAGRLLLVEPDSSLREVFHRMLASRGYCVDIAGNWEEALDVLEQSGDDVEVVLLDLNRPAAGQDLFFRKLKRIAPLVHPIAITGLSIERAVAAALRFDVFAILRRPVDLVELEFEIRRAQEQRGLKAALRNATPPDNGGAFAADANSSAGCRAVLEKLAELADSRQGMRPEHHARVSEAASILGRKMELPPLRLSVLQQAARYHDIGKICISDTVLQKAPPLTEQEWDLLRTHPREGHALLSRIPGMHQVAAIVLAHHEHFDGTGYPAGLSGSDIPLEARIIAVVDAYEAWRSDRSYRPRRSVERALAAIAQEAGGHFDPALVAALETSLSDIEPLMQ